MALEDDQAFDHGGVGEGKTTVSEGWIRSLPVEECPVCEAPTVLRFTMGDAPIRECRSCGHGFADYQADERHLSTVYGDDYFSAVGPGYPDYLSESDLLQRHGRRYGAILRRYAPHGRVLDVGSAAGFIAAGMRDTGLVVAGLEPNGSMARYACEILGLPTLNDCLENLGSVAAFDVVSMIQVVAHFVDPRRAFASAARVTRPGGYWLIEGWKTDSLVVRLLGKRWHDYNPPSVLHYFTMKSLDLLASEFGFLRVATGRPRKLISAAHAAGLFEFLGPRSSMFRVAAKMTRRIPRRLVLPYPGDDIFWAIYESSGIRDSARAPSRWTTETPLPHQEGGGAHGSVQRGSPLRSADLEGTSGTETWRPKT
jgi:SAM-dependent methyltransferase